MKLFDLWQLYMKNVKSPQHFIDISFYYMIGSALQRRVYWGPVEAALFPNLYIILCGRPGIGKGIVIKQVSEILKYHKRSSSASTKIEQLNFDRLMQTAKAQCVDQSIIDSILRAKKAVSDINEAGDEKVRERLLIPVAADSTTCEKLIESLSKKPSKIQTKCCPLAPAGIYTHHSLCFALEEISSLFKKKTENLVNFLIVAYDCGDFTYETLTRGEDVIKKCCLSFFGGTTPSFMQDTFDDKLLTEGFSSRTIFAYGGKNRFEAYGFPEFTQEQKEAKEAILDRILKLSTFVGQVTLAPDAHEYLHNYFTKILPLSRENDSPKLDPYYARKDIHVTKIAMCMHFADNDDYVISLETVKRALAFTNSLEQGMHHALSFASKNPLAATANKIVKFIVKNGAEGTPMIKILSTFYEDISSMQLTEVLAYLVDIQKIRPETVNKEIRYFLVEEEKE